MWISDRWKDYEVLDTSDGEKLERWGEIILRRPDPQTIWPKANEALWRKAQAHYHRSELRLTFHFFLRDDYFFPVH